MAYVRRRGNQLAIVHGARDPETGKVEQRILFTIYSKAEALEILGRSTKGANFSFRGLLERQYPDLRFNWKKIHGAISDNLDALPDLYEYKAERMQTRFRRDLLAFAKQLILADPQTLQSAAGLISEHRLELEYIAELIEWRIELCDQDKNRWNQDNPFCWRYSLPGSDVPVAAEQQATGCYKRGEYERAAAAFRLLIDCFDDYAEGHGYLGLIAYCQDQLEEAVGHFEKGIEVGRRLFPKRIAKSRYWTDSSTRPYMRSLRNLTMTLNELGRFDEAEAHSERLETECGDDLSAGSFRAAIYLNTGRWQRAADAATHLHKLWPVESFITAFALHELGQRDEATVMFLYGALNHPRAAKMLLGEKTRQPKTSDHNTGTDQLRRLHAFLAQQSRRSRKFFRDLVKHQHVNALLDEIEQVVERWHLQHRTGQREAFDRMQLMQTLEFARDAARGVGAAGGTSKTTNQRASARE